MTTLPRVSVIIPVYNRELYLRDALDSVVSQEGVEIELIVVDDGSTDSSRDIVREYPSAILIEQKNHGVSHARNEGLKRATAKYVKFLDSDDLLVPGILAQQTEFMERSAPEVIVYGDGAHFYRNLKVYRDTKVEFGAKEDQVVALLTKAIQTSLPLHRRTVLASLGGFDENLYFAEEYHLHIRLAMAGYIFRRLPGRCTYIRNHGSPNRLTNQNAQRIKRSIKTSSTRKDTYFELLQGHYNGNFPPKLRHHMVTGALSRSLPRLLRIDITGARNALSAVQKYGPHNIDYIICLPKAIWRSSRPALGRLRRRILT